MELEVVNDWIMSYGDDLKEQARRTGSQGQQVRDNGGSMSPSVFSFGDFERMQEELDFKGDFYQKVMRKSLVLRESLQ